MTHHPETHPVLYVQFADNGHIRKWSPEPFDGGVRYDAQAPLVEALAKIMPIRVQNGQDYAEVFFADGAAHSTHAMTMNPQDWLDIGQALAAARGEV
jgi:hypothetical protein